MTPTSSYDTTTEPDPTDTGSSYDTGDTDLPDGPFKDGPGAGPTPEPEEDGFRQKILDIIEARRKRNRDEYEQWCKDLADYYGGTGEPDPQTPTDPTYPSTPTTPDPQTPTTPTYGTTTPTPTTPTPTTTYGSGTPTSS